MGVGSRSLVAFRTLFQPVVAIKSQPRQTYFECFEWQPADYFILEHSHQGNVRNERHESEQLFLQALLDSGYALFLSKDEQLG